ncbi:MAG: ABC transporter ATP-binding protein, partial [Geodermatophilaceae bacterium]|nr:ABC transporter ATP-binding protein [Geodermatophilaceae bacterium]
MIEAIRRIRRYGSPYRRALAVGALLTLIGVALSLALPWPLQWIVDKVLTAEPAARPDEPVRALSLAVGALVALTVLSSVVTYWAARLLSAAGLQIANDLRVSVLSRLNRQSLRFHSRHRVGDLTARVTSDVGYTQDMLVQIFSTLLPSLLLVVGMFAVMLVLDATFTLLAVLVTPLLGWLIHRSRLELRTAARRVRKADGALASAATENLSAIHLVQAFTLESDRLYRFGGLSGTSLDAGLESVRLQSRFVPLVELASVASTAVVLFYGAQQVLAGELSLGVLLVFLSYLGSLYKPVKSLSKLTQVVTKGAAAAERILEVLDAPIDIVDRPSARARTVRGRVEFRGLSFSYGREPVLSDLSFTIDAGQNVALVGPTGAGKSTIAALIPRLVDAEAGAVLVDDLDVRDHQLDSLRRQIATVLQDTLLLEGTLWDNIVCGQRFATERDVRRAARLALVDEFAERLPDGLNTMIGERGTNLSGGQRQRVAIARAILRDAPIIILDEPTSALDAGSEELLLQALANLPAGRTRLVIAHRLSTVRDADRILVLEQGRIIESGT